jgi:hypothetical protein
LVASNHGYELPQRGECSGPAGKQHDPPIEEQFVSTSSSTPSTGPTNRTPPSSTTPVRPTSPGATSTGTGPRPISDRRELTQAQKEQFGGMKFGASFFGWLTATGTVVILTALLTATGVAVGQAPNLIVGQAAQNPGGTGLIGAIILLVVVLIGYFAGGYVAGRMARFSGFKQGVGVFLWALILTVIAAVLIAIAGTRFNLLTRLNIVAPIPMSTSALTTGAIIGALAVLVVTLIGAVLGGLAGMRFHRRVDRVVVYDA